MAIGREHDVEQVFPVFSISHFLIFSISHFLKTERNKIIHLVNGKFHIETLYNMIVANHIHMGILFLFFYR